MGSIPRAPQIPVTTFCLWTQAIICRECPRVIWFFHRSYFTVERALSWASNLYLLKFNNSFCNFLWISENLSCLTSTTIIRICYFIGFPLARKCLTWPSTLLDESLQQWYIVYIAQGCIHLQNAPLQWRNTDSIHLGITTHTPNQFIPFYSILYYCHSYVSRCLDALGDCHKIWHIQPSVHQRQNISNINGCNLSGGFIVYLVISSLHSTSSTAA